MIILLLKKKRSKINNNKFRNAFQNILNRFLQLGFNQYLSFYNEVKKNKTFIILTSSKD